MLERPELAPSSCCHFSGLTSSLLGLWEIEVQLQLDHLDFRLSWLIPRKKQGKVKDILLSWWGQTLVDLSTLKGEINKLLRVIWWNRFQTFCVRPLSSAGCILELLSKFPFLALDSFLDACLMNRGRESCLCALGRLTFLSLIELQTKVREVYNHREGSY